MLKRCVMVGAIEGIVIRETGVAAAGVTGKETGEDIIVNDVIAVGILATEEDIEVIVADLAKEGEILTDGGDAVLPIHVVATDILTTDMKRKMWMRNRGE